VLVGLELHSLILDHALAKSTGSGLEACTALEASLWIAGTKWLKCFTPDYSIRLFQGSRSCSINVVVANMPSCT
jgi:hypothetical protein